MQGYVKTVLDSVVAVKEVLERSDRSLLLVAVTQRDPLAAHPSPHFVANRSPPNSPLLTSISANRRISGSSRCSGMFGISS
jgi:hypothetical protein